jgi:hypothetical protein
MKVKYSEVGLGDLEVVASSFFEQFAGFSVVTVGAHGFTFLSEADNFGQ